MLPILWITFLILIASYTCGPVVDPDLWWHITVGRWILAHTDVPVVDYWNMSGVGKPWRAYSWSNELIFAAIDNSFGVRGLFVAQFTLAFVFVVSMAFVFGRIAKDWIFGSLVAALVACGSAEHFGLRPQSLTWVYFLFAIHCALKVSKEGLNLKNAFFLFVIMALWANAHITTVLGLLVFLIWGINWESHKSKKGQALKLILVSSLGMIATPYLGGELLTFLSKISHPFEHVSIVEFKPANLQQYSVGILLFLFVTLAIILHSSPRAAARQRTISASGFMLTGLLVIKFLPQALIVLGAVLCEAWAGRVSNPQGTKSPGLIEGISRLRDLFVGRVSFLLCPVFILLASLNLYKLWSAPLDRARTPVEPVNFIEQNDLPHPVLGIFDHGGYLMYRFSDREGRPSFLVAIDGRTNVTSPEVFKKHHAAVAGLPNWKEFIEFANPGTILWHNSAPLTAILLNGTDWCAVYHDTDRLRGYTVFVEKNLYWQFAERLPSKNCVG